MSVVSNRVQIHVVGELNVACLDPENLAPVAKYHGMLSLADGRQACICAVCKNSEILVLKHIRSDVLRLRRSTVAHDSNGACFLMYN